MKELDFEKLVMIAGGHSAFQLLWAGAELGLYDKLSSRPDMTLDEVAEALSLAYQPARILMIGLTALGLVKRNSEGHYRNADLTEARLVKGKPGYAAPILGWQAHIVYVEFEVTILELFGIFNVRSGDVDACHKIPHRSQDLAMTSLSTSHIEHPAFRCR